MTWKKKDLEERASNKRKNNIIREELIKESMNGVLNGGTYNTLVENIMCDTYGYGVTYCRSTAEAIVTEARRRIKNEVAITYPEIKEQIIAMLMDIVTESREEKDRSNAIKAIAELNKMLGNYEAQKVEAKVENQNININFGLDS